MSSIACCRLHAQRGVQCRAAGSSVPAQAALSRRQAALDLAAAVVGQGLLPRDAAALPSLFGIGLDMPAAEPALIPRSAKTLLLLSAPCTSGLLTQYHLPCRKRLQQNFAVLLLRSVYEAADSMDFMPMVRAWLM